MALLLNSPVIRRGIVSMYYARCLEVIMDRSTQIAIEDLKKMVVACQSNIAELQKITALYGGMIDKLSISDDRDKRIHHGLYVPTSDRLDLVRSKISGLVNEESRCFSARELRHLCRFIVGSYMVTMKKYGEIESVDRGFYRVTDKFLKLYGEINHANI